MNRKKLNPEIGTDLEKINPEVEKLLVKMMKEDPVKLLSYFVLIAGREAVKSNASTLPLSSDADIEGVRYKITCKIGIKKLPPF